MLRSAQLRCWCGRKLRLRSGNVGGCSALLVSPLMLRCCPWSMSQVGLFLGIPLGCIHLRGRWRMDQCRWIANLLHMYRGSFHKTLPRDLAVQIGFAGLPSYAAFCNCVRAYVLPELDQITLSLIHRTDPCILNETSVNSTEVHHNICVAAIVRMFCW